MGSCIPCFGSSNKQGNGVKEASKKDIGKEDSDITHQSHHVTWVSSKIWRFSYECTVNNASVLVLWVLLLFSLLQKMDTTNIIAQTFTFHELAAATKIFHAESLLGEGGFGCVHRGRLESTGQVIVYENLCIITYLLVVKQLDQVPDDPGNFNLDFIGFDAQ
ncbi:hypothetical protein OSB04_006564, partial [Centaurea solstitialis]